MKAITINQFGDRDVLQLKDLPIPGVKEGDILIRIKAAGVNPVDWKIRKGLLKGRLPHEFPIILGWDAAGIVEKIGSKVTRFKEGDEVMTYARKPIIQGGTYAEFVSVPEENVAKKPKNLSFEEASVIPLSALTAYQSLFDALKLERGETILIHAGAGGVGGYAIQLAKKVGAYVMTTTRKQNHEYVKGLGADEVIDYEKKDFCDEILKKHPEGLDAVYDMMGLEIQERSYQVLKAGGRLVTILAMQNKEAWEKKGYQVNYVFVAPNASQLEEIGSMAQSGDLKVHLTHRFKLEEAAKAQELSETGHVCGKIALLL